MKKPQISEIDEKTVNQFRIALNMCGVYIDNLGSEMILTCYQTFLKMGGNFDLSTASHIEISVNQKYEGKKQPPSVEIKRLDGLYEMLVKRFREDPENKPFESKEILYSIKEFIEIEKKRFEI